MGRQLVVGIGAQEDPLDVDAGELVLALEDVVAHRRRDVLLERHVLVGQEPVLLADVTLHLGRSEAEEEAQPTHQHAPGGRVERRQLLHLRLHRDRDAVVDQHAPVPVEDVAPGGGDDDVADLVVLRLRQVLVAGEHLQVPQAEEDDREHGQGDPAEDRHAQGQLGRDRRPALVGQLELEHQARVMGLSPPVV